MSIKVMADNNIDIPAKMDAMNYNMSQGYSPYTIHPYAMNSLNVSWSGLVATVQPGMCSVYGYTVLVLETETLTVPTNATGYVCLDVDLSQSAGKEGSIAFHTNLKQDNLLVYGNFFSVPLLAITSDAIQITTAQDIRFKNMGSRGGVYFESQSNGKVDLKNTSTNELIGCNYETTSEHFTGRYHFNGKKIYEQIFTFNGASFKANTWEASPALPKDTDLTSITLVGSTYRTGNVVYQIPYHESDDYKVDMYFSRLDRKVYVRAGNKNSAGACIVRIQYCKG